MFAAANNIIFNPTKSHCIRFCVRAILTVQFPGQLQGVALTWTDHIEHRGHVLCYNLDDTEDINARRRAFVHESIAFFTRFTYLTLALKVSYFRPTASLFMAHNCGTLTVLLLIHLIYRGTKRLEGSAWGVPYRIHRFLHPSLMSGDNFITKIATHFFSLAYSCLVNSNSKVSLIANNARISPLTNFSKYLHFTSHIYLLQFWSSVRYCFV